MKKFLFVVAASILLLSSCKSDPVSSVSESSKVLSSDNISESSIASSDIGEETSNEDSSASSQVMSPEIEDEMLLLQDNITAILQSKYSDYFWEALKCEVTCVYDEGSDYKFDVVLTLPTDNQYRSDEEIAQEMHNALLEEDYANINTYKYLMTVSNNHFATYDGVPTSEKLQYSTPIETLKITYDDFIDKFNEEISKYNDQLIISSLNQDKDYQYKYILSDNVAIVIYPGRPREHNENEKEFGEVSVYTEKVHPLQNEEYLLIAATAIQVVDSSISKEDADKMLLSLAEDIRASIDINGFRYRIYDGNYGSIEIGNVYTWDLSIHPVANAMFFAE